MVFVKDTQFNFVICKTSALLEGWVKCVSQLKKRTNQSKPNKQTSHGSVPSLRCHPARTTTAVPGAVGNELLTLVDRRWVSIIKRPEIPQNIWDGFVWELCNYSFFHPNCFFLLLVPVSPTLHHHLTVSSTFSLPCFVT